MGGKFKPDPVPAPSSKFKPDPAPATDESTEPPVTYSYESAKPNIKERPVTSPLAGLGYGAASSGSMGWADEAAGVGAAVRAGQEQAQSLPEHVGAVVAPLMQDNPRVKRALALKGVLGAYRSGRNMWRKADERAQQDQPGLHLLGQVGAGAATSVPIPGLGTAGQATRFAVEGGLAGWGNSTDPTARGQAADAMTGVALGGGLGAAGEAVGGAVTNAAPRIRRFAQNRRLAQLGIPNKAAESFPAGGAEGLVQRLQAQGVGTGVESRGRLLEQAEAANTAAEARRAGAIPNPAEEVPGQEVAQALRARSRKFGGEDVRDVRRAKLAQVAQDLDMRAAEAERRALMLEEQGRQLGLDRKFARPNPSEAMRAPETPPTLRADEPKTGAASPRGRRQKVPIPDERQAGRVRTPADVMAGPKNARIQKRIIEKARAEAQQARDQAAQMRANGIPEGHLGAGERSILEREADALAPDTPSIGELNQRRAKYGEAWQRPNSTADEAGAYQAAHGELNDLLERRISAQSPGAGEAWREAGRDQAAVIKAKEYLPGGMAQQDRAPAANMRNIGLAILSPKALAADVLIRGREHAIAAYGAEKLLSVPNSPFGRALRNRNIVATQGVEAAAREHFLRSATDPDYHEAHYEDVE